MWLTIPYFVNNEKYTKIQKKKQKENFTVSIAQDLDAL